MPFSVTITSSKPWERRKRSILNTKRRRRVCCVRRGDPSRRSSANISPSAFLRLRKDASSSSFRVALQSAVPHLQQETLHHYSRYQQPRCHLRRSTGDYPFLHYFNDATSTSGLRDEGSSVFEAEWGTFKTLRMKVRFGASCCLVGEEGWIGTVATLSNEVVLEGSLCWLISCMHHIP